MKNTYVYEFWVSLQVNNKFLQVKNTPLQVKDDFFKLQNTSLQVKITSPQGKATLLQ